MAKSNHQRVGDALTILRDALVPILDMHWRGHYGDTWVGAVNDKSNRPDADPNPEDLSFLLNGMINTWYDVFDKTVFPTSLRNYIFLLRDARNAWAHNQKFSSSEAIRILDHVLAALEQINDPEANKEVDKLKKDLERQVFAENERQEKRKIASQATKAKEIEGLHPWRELITPHEDVYQGEFVEAEYAAHLWQVVQGEAAEEYQDPTKFFARTFITDGLTNLLTTAAERLSGQGGNPVIDLQTNFGGGKTHSLIALYHLASGTPTTKLPGVDDLFDEQKLSVPAKVNRATFIGTQVSPSTITSTKEGIELHTLWGSIAYQLGGVDGYNLLAEDDKNATNPGTDKLVDLFKRFGPCLILIDEWVAYARDLYPRNGQQLVGGSFDTQFSFAQSLTEAADGVDNALVIVSLPVSELEIGGERGVDTLSRLKNIVVRVAAHWRAASEDESFEIVRRRLFDEIPAENVKKRNAVIDAFMAHYKKHVEDFPNRVQSGSYRDRMKAAYPIHPELFDRLLQDWSTLERFQRTRGILRLMSMVIHELWKKGDKNLLIMPGHIPVNETTVMSELTKHLPDSWEAIIYADVDGDNSLPVQIDENEKTKGRYSAARRVARTIFMGSAPRAKEAPGIERVQITLGTTQPGESPGVFVDATRALTERAQYLHSQGTQYWYDTHPTLNRTADDLAAGIADEETNSLITEMMTKEADSSKFSGRSHIFPHGPEDVNDDDSGIGLVVLPMSDPHIKTKKSVNGEEEKISPAVKLAKVITENSGNTGRTNKNLLVFLAADKRRVADLRLSVKKWMAWQQIDAQKDESRYDLKDSEIKQVESHIQSSEQHARGQLGEVFREIITFVQKPGTKELVASILSISGGGGVINRAYERLLKAETLIDKYSAVRIRMDLDRDELKVPGWEETGRMTLRELWDLYSRFLYMPKLLNSEVLKTAISKIDPNDIWRDDTFAVAEAYDEEAGRYRGLVTDQGVNFPPTESTLIVNPKFVHEPESDIPPGPDDPPPDDPPPDDPPPGLKLPKSFYLRSVIPEERSAKHIADILQEVVSHLRSTPGQAVEITLEVQASSDGYDQAKERTITENCNTLGIKVHEFE